MNNKSSKKNSKNIAKACNRVFAYVRVSTSKQDTTTQLYEIENYTRMRGMVLDMVIEETVSGKVDAFDRDLNKILKQAKCGDTIICTEISRLGRTMQGIWAVMNVCINRGITIIAMKENYVLDINSPTSKFSLSVYAFTAETERKLISERTKEGLEARKRAGVKLGRPAGAKNKKYVLDDHREKIEKWLTKGVKKLEIARRLKVNVSTLYEWMKRNNIAIS